MPKRPTTPELLPLMSFRTPSGTIFTANRSAMATALQDLDTAITALVFALDAVRGSASDVAAAGPLSQVQRAARDCWRAFCGDDQMRGV